MVQPYTETGKGHGRVEARTAQVCDASAVSGTASFPHMRQVVRITRGATHAKTGTARSPEVAYAVTSLRAIGRRPVLAFTLLGL